MRSVIFFMCLFLTCALFAQGSEGKKEVIVIHSDVYKTDRKIAVYLPPGYDPLKGEKLQVAYLFDGQWEDLFNYVTSTLSYLASIGEAKNMIVVGIYAQDRQSEFTPNAINEETKTRWKNPKIGLSALLDNHLRTEVFPLIAKKYNVENYRLGIGHSLGGTYLINSFSENSKLFNAYIAISPNLEYDNYEILMKAERLLKAESKINSFLNVSVGDSDDYEKFFYRGVKQLDSILSAVRVNGLKFNFDYLRNEDHLSSPLTELPKALRSFAKLTAKPSRSEVSKILSDESLSLYEEIKKRYNELEEWLGYQFQPTEDDLNRIAYIALSNKKADEGVRILNWALELYPNGINLYDSKAEMLENLSRSKDAKNSLKLGLVKLEATKLTMSNERYDYFKKILDEHLERLNKSSH